MGEEDSIPRSGPQNPEKRAEAEGAHTGAAGASAGGETTLDTGRNEAARAKDRMSIGPYILVKKLGEGGMGQVWLAEQTAPVKRQVALKLIKGGLYDSAVIQRFEAERQSLAVMNHPAIAKVFDAGGTADGQPYFVMEYVDGPPITRYCDNMRLKIRERLELFIKVCQGVQHAHQKAIIHRDLKPSNVLVAEVDRKPVPKIIDFGLAKAISPQARAEQTLFTQTGALIGTRGFMSPEQADPSVVDVDTRTDVYSLGVTLYALLAGTLPFDPEEWKRKPFDEVLRQLREEDPPSPSRKLSGEKETAKDSAMKRATEAKQLVASLRGDLDWITLKAVEKDCARRYGTASELAADIERYLQDTPVLARPAATGYRVRKYVQRHRVGVAVATGAVALLVVFGVAQSLQLRRTRVERDRATHERDRATRERDRANRVTDFMTGMFKVSDPSEARGNSIKAREILDKASKEIGTGLAKDPDLQAQMMLIMGTVYDRLGLYARAEPLMKQSVDIRTRVLGLENPETLTSMDAMAWLLHEEGRYAEAEKLNRETLDARRRVLGPEHPDTLSSMNNLAGTLYLEQKVSEAEKLQRETLEIVKRVHGPEHADTLSSMNNLASTLYLEANYAEAEKLNRETLDARRRVLGPDHPDSLLSMNNLASTLWQEGKLPEAEKLWRETLDARRRVLGPEHPDTLASINNMGWLLQEEGRYGEAEKFYREGLEIVPRVLGPDHPVALMLMQNLGVSLSHENRNGEAKGLFLKVIEKASHTHDQGVLAHAWYSFACGEAVAGHKDEALKYLRKAVDLQSNPVTGFENDEELKSLRGDPRFDALVTYAMHHGAAIQKPN